MLRFEKGAKAFNMKIDYANNVLYSALLHINFLQI